MKINIDYVVYLIIKYITQTNSSLENYSIDK